jgi:hypothetical protein
MTTRAASVPIEVSNQRLLLLADFLEVLPIDRFDYNHWVGLNWKGAPDLSCGTTACALGWACAMPEFQALGLQLSSDTQHVAQVAKVINPKLGVPDDYGDHSLEAAMVTFGLTMPEAEYLFCPRAAAPDLMLAHHVDAAHQFAPGRLATAIDVADHIRYFVEHR